MSKGIMIIGPSGSGKTSLGKMVADKLGYPYFDVDTIKKISVASVSVTAKKGSKSVNRNIEITMTKEGKEWKILYIE